VTVYSTLLVPPRNLTVNSLDLYTVPAGKVAVVKSIIARASGPGTSTLVVRHLVVAPYANAGNYTLFEFPVTAGAASVNVETRHVMRAGEVIRGLYIAGGGVVTLAISGFELDA